MKKEMRTLYVEGVANHDGPESCVVVREGGGEALTGVRAGQPLSREITVFRVPTQFRHAEGNIAGGAIREPSGDPARSENLCMYGVFMRENREIPWTPVCLIVGRAARGRPRP